MIYKVKEEFYVVISKDLDTLHLQRIRDGVDMITTEEEFENMQSVKVSFQDALSDFYDAQWIGLKSPEKMTIALMQEASEALNELDWKPWKEKQPNVAAYRKELADIGIFLLLCAKTVDMTLEDLLEEMFLKHLYNFKRKDHTKRSI